MNAADLTELKINILKFRANGDRYFSLFDKHIPVGLGAGTRILLYKIGNLTTIMRIIEKNPAAEYSIHDRKCVCDGMHALCKADIRDFPADGQDKYDIFENREMKFDIIIIMNPPFGKLYIKILAEAMKHIAEDGKVMSLQPINKWQEAKLFGLENPVAGSFVVDRFSARMMNDIFGINSSVDNGVVSNIKKQIAIVDNETLLIKLITRVSLLHQLKSELESTTIDKPYPVIFWIGTTTFNHTGRGKNCFRASSPNKITALRLGEIGHAKKYYAKNEHEQHLVWKFYQNPIMRFIIKEFGFGNIPYKIIPFITEFKDENGNTPLDAEWPLFKLAKWFDLTKQDLKYIYKSLEENMYDYEKAEIEEAIAEYDKSE